MSKTLKLVLIGLMALVLAGSGNLQGQTQDDPQVQTRTFTILVKAPGSFTVEMTPKNAETGDIEVEVVKGTAVVFTITTAAVEGYDGKINFSADGLPEGTVYEFSANDVDPGTTVTLTIQTSGMMSNKAYVCSLTASPA